MTWEKNDLTSSDGKIMVDTQKKLE